MSRSQVLFTNHWLPAWLAQTQEVAKIVKRTQLNNMPTLKLEDPCWKCNIREEQRPYRSLPYALPTSEARGHGTLVTTPLSRGECLH